jgi:hypothetical protein
VLVFEREESECLCDFLIYQVGEFISCFAQLDADEDADAIAFIPIAAAVMVKLVAVVSVVIIPITLTIVVAIVITPVVRARNASARREQCKSQASACQKSPMMLIQCFHRFDSVLERLETFQPSPTVLH